MVGYAVTVLLVAAGLLLSAVPLGRRGASGTVSWLLSALPNESPSLAFLYLVVSTLPAVVSGDLAEPAVVGWLTAGGAAFVVAPVLLRRSAAARPVLDRAQDDALGERWRERAAAGAPGPWRRRRPWVRIAVFPLPVLPSGVRRRRRVRYGPHRRHRLDVHAARRRAPGPRPVLVHLHGGGFRSGRPSIYARPLLHAFARHGWVCVSPGYRLRPASYDEMVDDVERVLAWVSDNAAGLGIDPRRIVLAGSSAGAHLALTTALDGPHRGGPRGTGPAPAAPAVVAAVGLYGYYGPADAGDPRSRPAAHAGPDAPPVMVVHGAQDTLLPPGAARDLVAVLRAASTSPVVHAELPGAQHSFDLLHSLRFEHVVDATWSFCAWALDRAAVAAAPDAALPPGEAPGPG